MDLSGGNPQGKTLWQHADFLKLWTGQTISIFGGIIGGTALSFTAILFLDASPFQLGLLNTMEMLPAFLMGLFAGAWVDKLRRKPLLIGVDLSRAFILLSIPLAAYFGLLSMNQLFVVALLVSLLGIVFNLAWQAYLPGLVGKEHVLEGNSKLGASSALAEAMGFNVGGWLVQLLSAPGTILFEVFANLISALSIGLIRKPEEKLEVAEEGNLAGEIIRGIRTVWGIRFLRASAITVGLEKFAGGIFGALIVLYMTDSIGFSPGVLAMTWAVGGISSFVGAALAPRINRWLGASRAMLAGLLIYGLVTLSGPLAVGPTVLSLVLLILLQLGDGFYVLYDINLVSTRQEITSAELLGRVTATMEVIGLGAGLLGALIGGILGELVSVRATLFLGCGLTVLGALIFGVVGRIKPTDAPTPSPAAPSE